tara:strand:+ start:531 stop:944 length:414 start_codon:yes stop_codon:yes gene_type:complete
MSIDNATPAEWDKVSRGPDKPEDCLRNKPVTKAEDIKESIYKNTICGALYHPNDHNLLDKQMFPKEDPVNHPPHYNKGGLEAIDYIEQQLEDGFADYLEGNVLKYMHRWRYKNGIEDLRKAKWYLDKLVQTNSFNYG